MSAEAQRCGGCGAVLPAAGGPTHPYMVSSPACWAAFGALQADELTRFGYPPVHGLAVDAFAASHGGNGTERRDRQSVFIHLIALHEVLDRGMRPRERIDFLRMLGNAKHDWPRLERPAGTPSLTHLHARGAADLDAYGARVREWAADVWSFWTPQHDCVRAESETWRARRG